MNSLYGAGFDVAHEVVVPMTTLDEATRGIGDLSLLKLDVQGEEEPRSKAVARRSPERDGS